jgi:hypothetical protein
VPMEALRRRKGEHVLRVKLHGATQTLEMSKLWCEVI